MSSSAQVRRQATASKRRSSARRKPKQRRKRRRPSKKRFRGRRRVWAGVVAIAIGAGAGFAIVHTGPVQRTLLEVTLPLRHDDVIRQQAEEKGVEAPLIAAIIDTESHFRDQTSSAGARGLMQITPGTAQEIARLSGGHDFTFEDLADPELNIRYGTFYVKHLLDLYDGNEVAAIAAYNAGPSKVAEWGGPDLSEGDIQFQETRDYVDKVLEKRDAYREKYPDDLGL